MVIISHFCNRLHLTFFSGVVRAEGEEDDNLPEGPAAEEPIAKPEAPIETPEEQPEAPVEEPIDVPEGGDGGDEVAPDNPVAPAPEPEEEDKVEEPVEPEPEPVVPEPVVPEPQPEPEDESGIQTECSCSFKSKWRRSIPASILGTDFSKSETRDRCDPDDCVTFCKTRVQAVTDMDLLSKAKSGSAVESSSVGDHICAHMHALMHLPAKLHLMASLTCNEKTENGAIGETYITNTNIESKQPLFCVNGKFRSM